MKRYFILLLFIFTLGCDSSTNNQVTTPEIELTDKELVEQISYNYILNNREQFSLEHPNQELRFERTLGHPSFGWRVSYYQIYKEIKVNSSYLTIFLNEVMDVDSTSYRLFPYICLSTNPEISKDNAYATAIDSLQTLGFLKTFLFSNELSITKYQDEHILIWKFFIATSLGFWDIDINAKDGKIIYIYK